MPNEVADVIVVGAGNAAFCAALAAEEQGAKVVMCEAAPEDESGGNSRFTAGSIRVVYNGFDSLNWMRNKGVRLIPIYGRQAFKIDGKFKFWGGLTVESVGGGPGLINMHTASAKKRRSEEHTSE